jgi:hypothetical protein
MGMHVVGLKLNEHEVATLERLIRRMTWKQRAGLDGWLSDGMTAVVAGPTTGRCGRSLKRPRRMYIGLRRHSRREKWCRSSLPSPIDEVRGTSGYEVPLSIGQVLRTQTLGSHFAVTWKALGSYLQVR